MKKLISLLLALGAPALFAAPSAKPNLVFIPSDNHDAWTFGCYGKRDIHTPTLTGGRPRACALPTPIATIRSARAAARVFLTGLIPSQPGVYVFTPHAAQFGPNAYRTIGELRTLPKIRSEAGYVCGLSGKRHWGDNLPHRGD